MKLRRKKQAAAQGAGRPDAGTQRRPGGGPPVQKLRKEVDALRRRVELLEQELQESRRLNKRLAEITDVVAEVLLPSDQRDDDRLRAALQRYDTAL